MIVNMFPILWAVYLLDSIRRQELYLIKSNLCFVVVVVVACPFISYIKNHFVQLKLKKFYTMFFSKSFVVLVLKFRSLVHFEKFLYMVWGRSPNSFFFFWQVDIHLYLGTICWEGYFFLLNGLDVLIEN